MNDFVNIKSQKYNSNNRLIYLFHHIKITILVWLFSYIGLFYFLLRAEVRQNYSGISEYPFIFFFEDHPLQLILICCAITIVANLVYFAYNKKSNKRCIRAMFFDDKNQKLQIHYKKPYCNTMFQKTTSYASILFNIKSSSLRSKKVIIQIENLTLTVDFSEIIWLNDKKSYLTISKKLHEVCLPSQKIRINVDIPALYNNNITLYSKTTIKKHLKQIRNRHLIATLVPIGFFSWPLILLPFTEGGFSEVHLQPLFIVMFISVLFMNSIIYFVLKGTVTSRINAILFSKDIVVIKYFSSYSESIIVKKYRPCQLRISVRHEKSTSTKLSGYYLKIQRHNNETVAKMALNDVNWNSENRAFFVDYI